MEQLTRQEFNQIAYNYEHVYYQVVKHLVLPPLIQCRFVFPVDKLIAMFQDEVHSVKRDTIHLGDLVTFKKYSNIVIACECIAKKGDKDLPWEEDRLPNKDYLLAMLKTLDPDNSIFNTNPPELLNVEEQKIQLKKETIDLLKNADPLNPYRACIKKRTEEERKKIKIKVIQNKKFRAENAVIFREKGLEFKKKQIEKLQRREENLQGNQNQQNQMQQEHQNI